MVEQKDRLGLITDGIGTRFPLFQTLLLCEKTVPYLIKPLLFGFSITDTQTQVPGNTNLKKLTKHSLLPEFQLLSASF